MAGRASPRGIPLGAGTCLCGGTITGGAFVLEIGSGGRAGRTSCNDDVRGGAGAHAGKFSG